MECRWKKKKKVNKFRGLWNKRKKKKKKKKEKKRLPLAGSRFRTVIFFVFLFYFATSLFHFYFAFNSLWTSEILVIVAILERPLDAKNGMVWRWYENEIEVSRNRVEDALLELRKLFSFYFTWRSRFSEQEFVDNTTLFSPLRIRFVFMRHR